ncbi:MAG: exo-alpha-sialidase, partial [Gemmatimonadetes bacterium]|nr:exo-alpha-sialidase [Gemmatimonadota bacterium]NIQ52663.1 exo-alpha-sialidase [Gemmatimonadota bacterium]NIU72799.1 exo-alpha-sialidase [Gammaproteobacteria bacterium]NIX43188.1 exo-alpha-sialidase [Gemmatimonadota bacterium]NIY07353.1 exo-alpha-sialidase [Gemmatimonadota bacterium]
AGPGSGEPNLTADGESVYLSWLEPSGDGYALRLARWDGTAWGATRTVLERDGLFVNWADFPAVAVLDDGTLAAHWLEKSGPGTYAYDVRMALSRDDGRSWGEDIIPHRDGVQAEHGFVSLLPLTGDLGMVWLDGRETVEGRPMTLRFTTVSPTGELGPETVLDTSTCDCCQTAMARTADGLVVAYRDRSADEVRDIYVTRRVAGDWTEPRPVHRDGWIIPACPVNGPALAARARRVALAWFTGAPAPDGAPDAGAAGSGQTDGRVLVAFSDDAGATFGPPVRVDDGGGMGRVAVELLDDGDALVTWLERTAEAGEVRTRRVGPDGAGPARTIAGTAAERASGFPRTARLGDRVVFAWTEPGAEGRIRAAVAALPSGDAASREGR